MKGVLVAGSVVLDIIGTYEKTDNIDVIDKTGQLDFYRIGGTAYNIAHNLLEIGCNVTLFTYLKDKTFATNFFRRKLSENDLCGPYVFFEPNLPEAAFIAHRAGDEIVSAVTSTSVQTAVIPPRQITQAVKDNDLIVLDCSFSPRQLSSFISEAHRQKKPIVVSGTSDSKVIRLSQLAGPDDSIDLVVMNRNEYSAILRISGQKFVLPDELSKDQAKEFCQFVRSKNVVVTLSGHGMVVVQSSGEYEHFPTHARKKEEIISALGAGDAVTAVIVKHLLQHGRFDWNLVNEEMQPQVVSSLFFDGATANAEAITQDTDVAPMSTIEDLFRRKFSLREKILFWATMLGMAGSLLGIIF